MKAAAALGALALVAGSLAMGQAVAPGSEAGGGFTSFDKNNDGRISMSEARSRPELNNSFQALDKDHDGYLSREEMRGWNGKSQGSTRSTAPSGDSSSSPESGARPGTDTTRPGTDTTRGGTGTGGATGGGISTTPSDR